MKYAKKHVRFAVVSYKNGESSETVKDGIGVQDVGLILRLEDKQPRIENIFTGLHNGFWVINH